MASALGRGIAMDTACVRRKDPIRRQEARRRDWDAIRTM
jgi:hypothetical protein